MEEGKLIALLTWYSMRLNDSIHITHSPSISVSIWFCQRLLAWSSAGGAVAYRRQAPQLPLGTGPGTLLTCSGRGCQLLVMETDTSSLKETSDSRQDGAKHITPCCRSPTEETWGVRWRELLLMRKKRPHPILCLVRVHFPTSSLIPSRRWRAVVSPCCRVDYWCICTNFSLIPSVPVQAHRFVRGGKYVKYVGSDSLIPISLSLFLFLALSPFLSCTHLWQSNNGLAILWIQKNKLIKQQA